MLRVQLIVQRRKKGDTLHPHCKLNGLDYKALPLPQARVSSSPLLIPHRGSSSLRIQCSLKAYTGCVTRPTPGFVGSPGGESFVACLSPNIFPAVTAHGLDNDTCVLLWGQDPENKPSKTEGKVTSGQGLRPKHGFYFRSNALFYYTKYR